MATIHVFMMNPNASEAANPYIYTSTVRPALAPARARGCPLRPNQPTRQAPRGHLPDAPRALPEHHVGSEGSTRAHREPVAPPEQHSSHDAERGNGLHARNARARDAPDGSSAAYGQRHRGLAREGSPVDARQSCQRACNPCLAGILDQHATAFLVDQTQINADAAGGQAPLCDARARRSRNTVRSVGRSAGAPLRPAPAPAAAREVRPCARSRLMRKYSHVSSTSKMDSTIR